MFKDVLRDAGAPALTGAARYHWARRITSCPPYLFGEKPAIAKRSFGDEELFFLALDFLDGKPNGHFARSRSPRVWCG